MMLWLLVVQLQMFLPCTTWCSFEDEALRLMTTFIYSQYIGLTLQHAHLSIRYSTRRPLLFKWKNVLSVFYV